MRLDYTEFSYGYAFTENLIRSSVHGPASAPIFPNLVQEAQLGYDVKIDLPGVPIFFQFKLPQLMVRDTAKEIARYGIAISTPFFRMPLMRCDLSNQHEMLVNLERRFPGSVFYTTPLSEDISAFNAAYRGARVHMESALFSPNDIGLLPDNRNHTVAYSNTSPSAWFCSEPIEIKRHNYENVIGSINNQLSEREGQKLGATTAQLREGLDKFLPDQIREAEEEVRQRIMARRETLEIRPDIDEPTREVVVELQVIRELARVGLGVDIAIAQPRRQETGEQE